MQGRAIHNPLALLDEDRYVPHSGRTKPAWVIVRARPAFVCRVVWCFCLFRRSW